MKPDTPTKTELLQRIALLESDRNLHRNAAMEADLRTRAAVRGEKRERAKGQAVADATAKLIAEPTDPDYRSGAREALARWMEPQS